MAELSVRRGVGSDLSSIIELLATSMHRNPTEPFEALFRWKHLENPFGESPSWVACDGERIVGFRTFLRWEFLRNGTVVRAVRAVDTATHPDYQGRGIFTLLTTSAVEELRADGVDLIFNTPNDKSRPGYLKMGWQQVGHLAARARVTNPAALVRISASRVPASIWSVPSTVGLHPNDAFAESTSLDQLLDSQPRSSGIETRRSAEFLRWRYGFEPLHYRVVAGDGGIDSGLAVFRLRRRGRATEAALTDVLAPHGDSALRRRLVGHAARAANADYTLTLGRGSRSRFSLRLPGGPILTARSLSDAAVPLLPEWDLSLGDIELF